LRSVNSAVFFALCRSPTALNTIRPFEETRYDAEPFKTENFLTLIRSAIFFIAQKGDLIQKMIFDRDLRSRSFKKNDLDLILDPFSDDDLDLILNHF
jgi:hypothetical protein